MDQNYNKLNSMLWKYDIGIERENLRCKNNASLALTPHPEAFGKKSENPYFKVDFSESQVEIITPRFSDASECYTFLETLTEILMCTCLKNDEYLWPYSMPCNLPNESEIPLGNYDDDPSQFEYRSYLAEKYGKKMQMISGIHFNFSFCKKYINELYNKSDNSIDINEYTEKIYMKTVRNCMKYQWILIALFGASPTEKGLGFSARNSSDGYNNNTDIVPDFSSLDAHFKWQQSLVEQGIVSEAREIYTPIRIKMIDDRISHIELRIIDINPLTKCGISKTQIEFITAFMFFCLNANENTQWELDYRIVSEHGLTEENKATLSEILLAIKESCINQNPVFENAVDKVYNTFISWDKLPSIAIRNLFDNNNKNNILLDLAKNYSNDAKSMSYRTPGCAGMELSTQSIIREAITKGVHVEVLDKAENIIALTKNDKTEFVKQATKTSKDTYITVLLMQNKLVSKEILSQNNIRVPQSINITKNDNIEELIPKIKNNSIVIKPKSTNCGVGISMFDNGTNADELKLAIDNAFSFDSQVLIEDFVPGQEYRFLVIDGKTEAVTFRRPASIIGDGVHTINELINEKNKEELRGSNHDKPLCTIVIDEHTKSYLSEQNISTETVPRKEERVYLRKNSNISMGGDSIDFTDKASDYYKRIAERAADSFGAVFCGVDMIISGDISQENEYAIIEVNHNPMICMHDFPFEGKSRGIAEKVLKTLGFK